jgi:exosortase
MTAGQHPFLAFVKTNWLFVLGLIAIVVPTMISVARFSWGTDAGAHSPIVLATGLWLVAQRWYLMRDVRKPAPLWAVVPLFVGLLLFYYLSSVTQIIEINGYMMYGLLLIGLISFVGWKAVLAISFPLFYLLFALPPPESLVSLLTQPLKIWISEAAVSALYVFGYPIAGSGVMIQVGQYQLLVAAACSGLNSLITLSAISMFYIYMRHRMDWGYTALMMCAVVPVAIFANLVRVLILILLTYHAGEASAQGFFHDFAGLTLFVTALLTIMALDYFAQPLWQKFQKRKSA